MKSSPCSIDALENHSLKDQELDFLVIGHAYGIPKNIYLAEKLSAFLNKQNLWKMSNVGVVFAGDVFHTPSAQKWNKLKKDLPKFIIAPGNHELSDGNDGDDIKLDYQQKLSKSSFHSSFQVNYPLIVKEGFSGTLLIMLLDTNNPNGLAEALNRVRELDLSGHDGLVIVSHHVIDPDMASYAHGIPEHFLQPDALKQRNDFMELLEELSTATGKSVWLISGDTGSNKEHESLVCKNKTPYFMTIVNGLGDKKGDKLLGFSGANLFYISL